MNPALRLAKLLRPMTALRLLLGVMVLAADPAWSQQAPAARTPGISRVWTNISGKQLTAEYLGIQGANVVLKLTGGKVTFVPVVTLCADDNAFLRENRLDYHAAWQAWPQGAGLAMQNIVVKEEAGKAGDFVYSTAHFRFHSDVNLGTTLMRDLARTFELTFQLHSSSPFGILAKPGKDLYEARLFGTMGAYHLAGGPGNSAGVYIPKEKVFLAPLELMGIRSGSAGYRKVSDEYDVSTIVHELTHMLTHEMLDNLPVWANEGYAEYIASIPIEGKAFRTDNDKIRDGIRDVFVMSHLKSLGRRNDEMPEMSRSERDDYLKGGEVPALFKVEKVLRMNDSEWATAPNSGGATFLPGRGDYNRMARLYRTAHLIIYYFIQIEGEKGVTKIRRFLEENRRHMDRYHRYEEEYQAFEAKFRAFTALPGVKKLADGRYQYPSNLTPPTEPVAPFSDPNLLKLGGLGALLDGESAADAGARIEAALVKDLEINLRFLESPRD